jgi:hypothetical protein
MRYAYTRIFYPSIFVIAFSATLIIYNVVMKTADDDEEEILLLLLLHADIFVYLHRKKERETKKNVLVTLFYEFHECSNFETLAASNPSYSIS